MRAEGEPGPSSGGCARAVSSGCLALLLPPDVSGWNGPLGSATPTARGRMAFRDTCLGLRRICGLFVIPYSLVIISLLFSFRC